MRAEVNTQPRIAVDIAVANVLHHLMKVHATVSLIFLEVFYSCFICAVAYIASLVFLCSVVVRSHFLL